jgi:hypothetical protein
MDPFWVFKILNCIVQNQITILQKKKINLIQLKLQDSKANEYFRYLIIIARETYLVEISIRKINQSCKVDRITLLAQVTMDIIGLVQYNHPFLKWGVLKIEVGPINKNLQSLSLLLKRKNVQPTF